MLIGLLAVPLSLYPALADGGDFKNTDFVAAAPYTYDHDIGGGAYDDRTIGDRSDVVEQLEGVQFTCGDVLTFLAAIELDPTVKDRVQTAEFDFRFLGNSTGQAGAAIVDILGASVNYGAVQAGDGPGGTDSFIKDDGQSTATLVKEQIVGTLFTPGAQVLGTVRVTDLEAAERIVIRIDTRLACKPLTTPTGNLQAQLSAGRVVYPDGTADTISTGQQTIPFLRVADIAGANEPVLKIKKTVTSAGGTCGVDDVEELTVTAGTIVKYCYRVSNPGTAGLMSVEVVDNNGTSGTSDDFVVALTGLSDVDRDGSADDLASGAVAWGQFLVRQNASGTVINTAKASGKNVLSGGSTVDLNASDTATVNVQVPAVPALVLDKRANSPVVNAGDTITYELILANVGGGAAMQLALSDQLPANMTYVSGSSRLNGVAWANPVAGTWSLPTLQGGQSHALTFQAKVNTVAAGSAYLNVATASGSDSSGSPIPPDNSSLIPADIDPDDRADARVYGALTWTSESTMVAYEDLKNTGWSDWDYNDFVVKIDAAKGTTPAGNLAVLELDYEALARGAAYNHRFIHDLPIEQGGRVYLTVRDPGGQIVRQESRTFTTNTQFAIIERTRQALPPPAGSYFTNTPASQTEYIYGYKASLTVVLDNPTANPESALPPLPWDPYIYVYNTGEQVHLVIPGHMDNTQLVNGEYDPTTPLLGYDLPLAKTFQPSWYWPIEFVGIWRGYPDYVGYLESGGTMNLDWADLANADQEYLWRFTPWRGTIQLSDLANPPTSRYFGGPIVADLDGAGRPEIVIGNLLANRVEVRNHVGGMLPGWPKSTQGSVKATPAVADLDGDGDLEILAGAADGYIYAWHHDGATVSGWPLRVGGDPQPSYRILSTPALANLDGTDGLELVIALADGRLYVYDTKSRALEWTASLGEVADLYGSQTINSSPAIADLDGNGSLEIVVGSYDKQIYAFQSNGTARWVYATGDAVMSSPAIADIDPGSPGLEVFVGSGDGYVYLLDKDGKRLWRQATGWTVRSSPAFADLDQNGDLEILIGSDDDRLWAWHHDGTRVDGWPQSTGADVFSSPTVGDIDDDGAAEVVVGSDDAHVYAWEADGKPVAGWPKQTGLSVKGKPALANLDRDSALEVIVGDFGGTLYLWDIPRYFLPVAAKQGK